MKDRKAHAYPWPIVKLEDMTLKLGCTADAKNTLPVQWQRDQPCTIDKFPPLYNFISSSADEALTRSLAQSLRKISFPSREPVSFTNEEKKA